MRRFSVRQINAELHALLSARYPLIEVEGEVSNLATPSSGHAYLTLRDNDAILAAVVWRNTWRQVDYRPRRGDKVVCRGKLGVYPGKGAYQLYVTGIAPAGAGALAAEIARRKARLEADGLLDPRRKRRLPRFPKVVGVATSLTGAALQDFLKVSRERHPAARILVAGCTVQGAHAAGSVVQAIDLLLEDGRAEVIVVTRGGGSKEDLLAFQDEGLARYLAHCPVPVVSAVGHQIDTTLADLVADAVAPTPSAGAVAVLPDGRALSQRVDDAMFSLEHATRRRIERRRERVSALQRRLRHPGQRLIEVRRRARELERRLHAWMAARLRRERAAVAPLRSRLVAATTRRIPLSREQVGQLSRRLHDAATRDIARRRTQLEAAEARARALSPVSVLSRGYAVVLGPSGVVHRADEVSVGDALRVRVHQGELAATVTERHVTQQADD